MEKVGRSNSVLQMDNVCCKRLDIMQYRVFGDGERGES